MSKIKLGKRNFLFPYLPVLVGATVGGKPNYITIGLVCATMQFLFPSATSSIQMQAYGKTGRSV